MPSGVHTYSPSTVVGTNDGPDVWTGASNAVACDGVYASTNVFSGFPFLTASGFAVTDPSATVTNAEILVTAYSNAFDGQLYVYLIIGGVSYYPSGGAEHSFFYLTPTITVYSFTNSTWVPSINWATANLSNVQVKVQASVNAPDTSALIYIDCVRLNIYYTTPGGGGSPQLDLCFKLGF